MNRTIWRAIVAASGALLLSCGSDDDGAVVDVDVLEATTDDCPVDLAAAIEASGFETTGGATVEMERGSGDRGGSGIDQVGGVLVTCSQPIAGDDELTAYLLASDAQMPALLFLPLLQAALDVPINEIEAIVPRLEDAVEGEVADLGVDGPVALVKLGADGAEGGVLLVEASSLSGDQVASIAATIVAGL